MKTLGVVALLVVVTLLPGTPAASQEKKGNVWEFTPPATGMPIADLFAKLRNCLRKALLCKSRWTIGTFCANHDFSSHFFLILVPQGLALSLSVS